MYTLSESAALERTKRPRGNPSTALTTACRVRASHAARSSSLWTFQRRTLPFLASTFTMAAFPPFQLLRATHICTDSDGLVSSAPFPGGTCCACAKTLTCDCMLPSRATSPVEGEATSRRVRVWLARCRFAAARAGIVRPPASPRLSKAQTLKEQSRSGAAGPPAAHTALSAHAAAAYARASASRVPCTSGCSGSNSTACGPSPAPGSHSTSIGNSHAPRRPILSSVSSTASARSATTTAHPLAAASPTPMPTRSPLCLPTPLSPSEPRRPGPFVRSPFPSVRSSPASATPMTASFMAPLLVPPTAPPLAPTTASRQASRAASPRAIKSPISSAVVSRLFLRTFASSNVSMALRSGVLPAPDT
mmetsp:Transcript_14222/g.59505  ORF Transcript_14222/g.59505 Transcript_14222/m.59505 type:complete len:363 (-) Transcript_14222:928-2016(-)